jgi:hypothetical protein
MADQYRQETFHAFEMTPDGAAPPIAGTRKQASTKGAHYDFLEFSDSGGEYAYIQWMIPEDFDTSNGTFSVKVYGETVPTSGDYQWEVHAGAYSDGEDIDGVTLASIGSATITSTAPSRELQISGVMTAATTIKNATKGDLVAIRVTRNTASSSGAMVGVAVNLIKVVIQWHTTADGNKKWTTGAVPASGKLYREKFFPASRFTVDKTYPPSAGTRQGTTLKAAHYPYLAFADTDASIDLKSGTYKWTNSTADASEYYLELAAGGDPGVDIPMWIYEDGIEQFRATAPGGLSGIHWAWGNNDGLLFDTIYIGSDPSGLTTIAGYYPESAYVNFMVPQDFEATANEMSYRIYWEAAATSGTVRLGLRGDGYADNEDIDEANSDMTITEAISLDTVFGTTRYLNISGDKLLLQLPTLLSAGDLSVLGIYRSAFHSTDSLIGDIRFIGLGIQWLSDEASNAQWS